MDSEVENNNPSDDTIPGKARDLLRMRITDLLWLLAYPIYQIVGTFRHEGSHAIAGIFQGATITEFVFWPSLRDQGFYWGYVSYLGDTNWLFLAAPYIVDLLTYMLFFLICMRVRFRRKWLWLNLIILGMISPLVNSLYNYWGSEGSSNDVGRLFEVLPRELVHGYFILTLVLYVMGIWMVFRRSRSVSLRGSEGWRT
jgi:hypothetical protein